MTLGTTIVCTAIALTVAPFESLAAPRSAQARRLPRTEVQRPTVAIWNTGLAQGGREPQSFGRFVVATTGESWNGSDLNLDGDRNDLIPLVLDTQTWTTVNPGVAIGSFLAFDGTTLALHVPEASQGNSDLNGDGDTLDQVLHVHDMQRGTTHNLGLTVYGPEGSGNRLAFFVIERSQGADLNGDGDALDNVLHTLDVSSGEVVNWRLACFLGTLRISGRYATALASENDQGRRDLNGDRDSRDQVLHVLDLEEGVVRNPGISSSSGQFIGKKILFHANEHGQGADLNQNGLVPEPVLFEYDLTTGALGNHRIVTNSILPSATSPWTGIFAFEAGWQDWNGDGDAQDEAYFGWDSRTERLVPASSQTFAGEWSLGSAGPGSAFRWRIHHMQTGATRVLEYPPGGETAPFWNARFLAYATREGSLGRDYNGDGDRLDEVMYLDEFDTGQTLLLDTPVMEHCLPGAFGACEYEYTTFVANDQAVAWTFSEEAHGARDLNGDGDASDWWIQALEIGKEELHQSRISAPIATVPAGLTPILAGKWVAWAGYESEEPNGSGDHVYAFDLGRGKLLDLELQGWISLATDGWLGLAVSEAVHGDRNGDGDALDAVLHLVPLD